jgi:hypothetical protein
MKITKFNFLFVSVFYLFLISTGLQEVQKLLAPTYAQTSPKGFTPQFLKSLSKDFRLKVSDKSIEITYDSEERTEHNYYVWTTVMINSETGIVESINRSTSGNVFWGWKETWYQNKQKFHKSEWKPKVSKDIITSGNRGPNQKELLAINKVKTIINFLVNGSIPALDDLTNKVLKEYARVKDNEVGDKHGEWSGDYRNLEKTFETVGFNRDVPGSNGNVIDFLAINLLTGKTEAKKTKYLKPPYIVTEKKGTNSYSVSSVANPQFNPKTDRVTVSLSNEEKESLFQELLIALTSEKLIVRD